MYFGLNSQVLKNENLTKFKELVSKKKDPVSKLILISFKKKPYSRTLASLMLFSLHYLSSRGQVQGSFLLYF